MDPAEPTESSEPDEYDEDDEEVITYTGPRPSPARRWSSLLVLATMVAALGSVALLVIHLIERYEFQRAKSGHVISADFISSLRSFATAVSRITTVATVVILVVAFVWMYNRRSGRRLAADGESGVETSLASIPTRLCIAFWVFVALALVSARIAASYHHTGTSLTKSINSRGYLAAGDVFRTAAWASLAALVVKATRQQDTRELATSEELPTVADD